MLFKDVIGQQEVKQHLVEMVAQNRLSHALLFLGKEGSGALPLALAFAQYVSLLPVQNTTKETSLFGDADAIEKKLPATPEEADEWMAKQTSFSKAAGLVHPDIHFSYPVIKKTTKGDEKPISTDWVSEWRDFTQQLPYGNIYDWLQFINAENKQGNITAQECNNIIQKLNLKSFESGFKILLMWMPEYMGKEGNRLLKLIEEPPPDTLFLFVAENESKMLFTILSRCQLIKIPPIDFFSVESALIERCNISAEEAKRIASISSGNYREALQLWQHSDEDYHLLLREWLNATLMGKTVMQVKAIEDLARLGRENQKQFLRYFTHLLECAIRLRLMNPVNETSFLETFSSAETEFVPRLNKAMTLEQQQAISEELDKAAYYIERNANARILFHALTIKTFHIVKNNSLVSVW